MSKKATTITSFFKPTQRSAPADEAVEPKSKKQKVGREPENQEPAAAADVSDSKLSSVVAGDAEAPAVEPQDDSSNPAAGETDGDPAAVVDQDEAQELTEEQLKAIEKNRAIAQAKLQLNALLKLEKATMAPDWLQAFKNEIEKDYFLDIKRFLAAESKANKTVFPVPEEIYSFTHCPLSQVKVVIIGQDPYHGPGQAHGLCFSVKPGVKPPPSLVNIYKELNSDLGPDNFPIRKKMGYLEEWSKQGVLLLNASLTVRRGEANSHANCGWMKFTDAIIAYLNTRKRNLVFILWGAFAQKKGSSIDGKKHLVLKGAHPSPLSVTKFLGCKHFSKTNEYLRKNDITEIDWNAIPMDP
ncbi:uracil-DNA glycosylase-like protein [Polychytrium aggregatum]|uniref:uracil-DNA glycosylase-like protein n=1 Tax=Polychytrium aggregatum TaxID=110093 RepID=UPI0022FE8C40|nr:uracil-DNA glycosylase-like protein [Polychytrium aggregatum]KAI9202174.1 uracil-DNA glycosylase-like protein [Polychytrium aggregatum]